MMPNIIMYVILLAAAACTVSISKCFLNNLILINMRYTFGHIPCLSATLELHNLIVQCLWYSQSFIGIFCIHFFSMLLCMAIKEFCENCLWYEIWNELTVLRHVALWHLFTFSKGIYVHLWTVVSVCYLPMGYTDPFIQCKNVFNSWADFAFPLSTFPILITWTDDWGTIWTYLPPIEYHTPLTRSLHAHANAGVCECERTCPCQCPRWAASSCLCCPPRTSQIVYLFAGGYWRRPLRQVWLVRLHSTALKKKRRRISPRRAMAVFHTGRGLSPAACVFPPFACVYAGPMCAAPWVGKWMVLMRNPCPILKPLIYWSGLIYDG